MKRLHSDMQQTISEVNTKTQQRVNKKRKMYPQLKKGDKVYLHTKNLKSKRPSKKLDHVKVGPFLIRQSRGPVNYELQLPPDAKVHPVFHVSLLEPADSRTPLQKEWKFEAETEEYEVEKILEQRGQEYFVKWKDCDESESTWEPIGHLRNCQTLLRQFHQTQQTQQHH